MLKRCRENYILSIGDEGIYFMISLFIYSQNNLINVIFKKFHKNHLMVLTYSLKCL